MATVKIEANYKVTTIIHDFTDNTVEEGTCYCKTDGEAMHFFNNSYLAAHYCLFNREALERRVGDGDEQTITLDDEKYSFVVKFEKIVTD